MSESLCHLQVARVMAHDGEKWVSLGSSQRGLSYWMTHVLEFPLV